VGPSTGLFDVGGQRLVTPPIRGRAGELKVIGALVTALVGGRGGVLVIEGPPGIGKSRLLTEVMALADKGGVRTASPANSSPPAGQRMVGWACRRAMT
jgi:MoxR-like ATPase